MMRSFILSIFSLSLPLTLLSCTPSASASQNGPEQPAVLTEAPDTVRILAIGNSFSEDAVENNLYELFKAAGTEAVIGNMYIGGCSLEKHYQKMSENLPDYSYRKIVGGEKKTISGVSLMQALADEKWDYISFQQGAGLYRDLESCFPYLPELIKYARKYCPNKKFKTIYHATWAAAQTSDKNYFINYFHSSQGYMYTSSNEMTKALDDSLHFSLVCNSIDAVQNARTCFGDTMNRDGWHLSYTHGRFTAACLWFERISGKNVLDNPHNLPEISDVDNRMCKYAAHYAALFPYRIVDISDTTRLSEQNPPFADPPADPEPQPDDRLLAKWNFDKSLADTDGFRSTWTTPDTPLGTYAYSNNPGEVGYYNANDGGSGRLSYVQIDKTAYTGEKQKAGRYLLNGTPGGQPAVCGHMRGDYWLFETTGTNIFPAGTKLRLTFTMHPDKYGAKYWRVEYLDGEQWIPASQTASVTIHDQEVVYNLSLTAGQKTNYVCEATLKNAMTAFKVRVVCCSSQQVNDKWFDGPNTPSVTRIAGMKSSGDNPEMRTFAE